MRWARLRISAAAIAAVLQIPGVAVADRLDLTTTETRTVVFIRTDPDKLAKALPAGWAAVPGSGAAKDANLVLILIEGLSQSDADGKAAAYPDKYAVWGTSAKNVQSGAAAFMVIGGMIAPAQAAPGAYGVYKPAKVAMTRTARSNEAGATQVEETWDMATEGDDRLSLSARYERGVAARAHVEPKVSSVAKPDFYRLYKADQVSEFVYSVPAGRTASRIALSASGPLFAGLLDGAEVVAVATVPAYHRQIYLPD